MPRIYAVFSGLRQIGNSCDTIASKIQAIQSDFQRTVMELDWDVRFQSNINSTATQLARKLEQYSNALESCQQFVEEVYNKYTDLDQYNMNTNDTNISRILGLEGQNGYSDSAENIDWDSILSRIFSMTDDEKDFFSVVETFMNIFGKWANNGEAGVLKGVLSYYEDFCSFFIGDKKGLSGASDLCNLSDSSIDVWTKLYDYFAKMYKVDGLKTGFFGQISQGRVAVLGVASDLLGLIASVLSASDGLDSKQWQSIVADYVDSGKDLVSVIGSTYKLSHIGNVTSLANVKSGFWSGLDIYSAIGNAGLQVISQGLRSHEKYYADGEWNLGDTAATGIDISMAGIYGISHSLSLGLDDVIFGVIDNATGGNGNTEMSYFEKAAEGYKILAQQLGESIVNWWTNLST